MKKPSGSLNGFKRILIMSQNDYSDKQYAMDFLILLSRFKHTDQVDLVEVSSQNNICSTEYQNFLSFKTMICEMIFKAINNFPLIIKEYTIKCKNNKGTCLIKIGVSDHVDNEGELSVLTLITPNKTFYLNKTDVTTICISNRSDYYNKYTVYEFMSILYGGPDGHEPSVETSWVSTKNDKKEF